MKSVIFKYILLFFMAVSAATLCYGKKDRAVRTSGYVGMRPLPRTQQEAESDWVKGLSKIGTYDEQLKPNSFAAKYTDVLYEYQGNFHTKKCFFEHYLPFDRDWIDTDPKTNPLVKEIMKCESQGWNVEHILICREAGLVGKGKIGPFKEDPRILYQRDVDDYRQVMKDAYERGMIKKSYYKLIQLLQAMTYFIDNPEATKIIETMDGVCCECHQFGIHWPYETGKTRPDALARAAKWTLDHGKEYTFTMDRLCIRNMINIITS